MLEEKWKQAYQAVFRFGPCQPSMVFRYLRTLEGVSPPLSLTHLSCQTTAKAFVATRASLPCLPKFQVSLIAFGLPLSVRPHVLPGRAWQRHRHRAAGGASGSCGWDGDVWASSPLPLLLATQRACGAAQAVPRANMKPRARLASSRLASCPHLAYFAYCTLPTSLSVDLFFVAIDMLAVFRIC